MSDVVQSPPDDVRSTQPDVDAGFQQVDPRFVGYTRVAHVLRAAKAMLGAALLVSLIQSARWFTPNVRTIVIVASLAWPVLDVILAAVRPKLLWRHTRYRVSANRVDVRTGMWWRSHTVVPRKRLQYLEVKQGPLERAFGLSRLVMHTAGTTQAATKIPGLAQEQATELRDQLMADIEAADGL